MALTKILNDENKSYKPVLTDKLVYDTKPTMNSFNGITSDAVARAIAGASGEVPAVTESDNGKILTAIYDDGGAAVEWVAPSAGGMTKTLIGSATNASAVSGMLNSKLTMESGVTTIPANSLVMTVFDITIDSGETLPSWEIKPFSVTVAQGEDPYDSRVTALNSLGSTLLQPQSGSLYTNNGVVWGYTTSALNVGSGYGIAFQLQHDTIQSYSVNVHLYVIS